MGFWSTLGKIGAVAGPIAAAPFTGGASATLLGLGATGTKMLTAGLGALPALGATAAGAAKGDADQRLTEAQLRLLAANNANTFNLGTARDKYQADLDRFKAGVDLPATRAAQAAKGGLMANLQDVQIGRPTGSTIPTFTLTGGLRPSAIGEEGRAAGKELQRQALLKLMDGETLPDYAAPTYQDASGSIGAGTREKALGAIGLGTSLAAPILQQVLAARKKTTPLETMSGAMNGNYLRNVQF